MLYGKGVLVMINAMGGINECVANQELVNSSIQEIDTAIAEIKERYRKKGVDVNTSAEYQQLQRVRQSAFISLNALVAMGSPAADIRNKCRVFSEQMCTIGDAFTEGVLAAEKCYLKTTTQHEAFTTALLAMDANSLLLCSRPKSLTHKADEPEYNGVAADAKSYAKKYVAKRIKDSYGKPAALAFKVAAQAALGHAPETDNPYRDLIISSTVAVGVGEALSLLMQRSPAYAVVATSNIVYDLGCRAEKGLAYLESQKKIQQLMLFDRQTFAAGEGPSFTESLHLAKGIITTVKIPGTVIREVQSQVTAAVAGFADSLGLTEKNIAELTNQACAQMAANNPHLFEDMWMLQ
jgi:hypothetical protein